MDERGPAISLRTKPAQLEEQRFDPTHLPWNQDSPHSGAL